jgi:hypothetical protein
VEYSNKYNYSFKEYSTALQPAFTIMDMHDQPMPERMKVLRLVDRVNATSHTPLIATKQNCMNQHHDNWTNDVNYMIQRLLNSPLGRDKRQDTKRKGC